MCLGLLCVCVTSDCKTHFVSSSFSLSLLSSLSLSFFLSLFSFFFSLFSSFFFSKKGEEKRGKGGEGKREKGKRGGRGGEERQGKREKREVRGKGKSSPIYFFSLPVWRLFVLLHTHHVIPNSSLQSKHTRSKYGRSTLFLERHDCFLVRVLCLHAFCTPSYTYTQRCSTVSETPHATHPSVDHHFQPRFPLSPQSA